MWKNGRTPKIVSSRVTTPAVSIWAMFATRFPWVSFTPFGSPVVPEE